MQIKKRLEHIKAKTLADVAPHITIDSDVFDINTTIIGGNWTLKELIDKEGIGI